MPKKKGAMALFGEKYGDIVRTVAVPGFSLELCGGTHVHSTGEIGAFLITAETSIASGVRRIEAITGSKVVQYMLSARDRLEELSVLLNSPADKLVKRITELLDQRKKLEKEINKLSTQNIKADIGQIIDSAVTINDIKVIVRHIKNADAEQLKELGDSIRGKSMNTAALITGESDGKLNLVCVITDDLIKSKGLNAGNIIRETAKAAGGGGGGRAHLATAGAKDISGLEAAQREFQKLMEKA
ncbi:MAG: hypothetical protein JXB44_05400 [Calditrichaceae bacterium]|nr:hypothetical protein [Calditrichaceae bacterium]